MYSNIIVPISFEDEAKIAAAMRVAHLLQAKGGKITLMHVIEEIPAYVINYLPQDYMLASRSAIEADLTRLATAHGPATHALVEGHSGRTILEFAKKAGADLIVIGSHRPGMQDLLMGSTAAHVVRHSPCAVHVLR
ncbi:universal stress protein [Puniceibacterium sediminis]|uniref:Nucleotide-binding universal stress protein, UspA family n=1 Tax=Puniceibacterium sediminis TaxID=1608407 RepID=A0A238ZG98_9RHOB|nr:universal stress protein [Puniceibacterium sediminis]SNR81743.1 Nucleotide-binding universal stress protein, UspA family [Puniceibacterium sediminis]